MGRWGRLKTKSTPSFNSVINGPVPPQRVSWTHRRNRPKRDRSARSSSYLGEKRRHYTQNARSFEGMRLPSRSLQVARPRKGAPDTGRHAAWADQLSTAGVSPTVTFLVKNNTPLALLRYEARGSVAGDIKSGAGDEGGDDGHRG